MPTVYYGETDRTRGVFIYSVSQTDTTVTITVQSQLQFKSRRQSGYRLNSIISGEYVDYATGYASTSYSDFTTVIDTYSYSKTYNRTNSDQVITIGSNYYGEKVDGWAAGGMSGSTSVNITIPALEGIAHIKVNGEWKRGKVWINDNGTWKQGLIWKNINGVWQKGS